MNDYRILIASILALLLAPLSAEPVDLARHAGPVRLACVGDSITFGAGVKPRKTMAYPAQLGRFLGEKWEVRNFGVNGATLLRNGDHPYHKTPAYQQSIAWKPDVVVIKLGTNDSKHPAEPGGKGSNNWRLKDEFGANAGKLVADYRASNPEVKVYVCLPVPAFPGRWNINGATVEHEIIPILKNVAREAKCDLIDLHAALAPHEKLFPDTVHPNAAGATVIAKTVYRALTGKDAPVTAPGAE